MNPPNTLQMNFMKKPFFIPQEKKPETFSIFVKLFWIAPNSYCVPQVSVLIWICKWQKSSLNYLFLFIFLYQICGMRKNYVEAKRKIHTCVTWSFLFRVWSDDRKFLIKKFVNALASWNFPNSPNLIRNLAYLVLFNENLIHIPNIWKLA